jgi:hypothetical protein
VDQEVLINSCNISLISLVKLEMFRVEYGRLVSAVGSVVCERSSVDPGPAQREM